MAVTRLERKGRRNKARAKARVNRIKFLSKRPPVVNVDVEAIKAEWAKKETKAEAKAEKAEAVAEVAETAVAEEAAPKKKAPAKKKAEKKD